MKDVGIFAVTGRVVDIIETQNQDYTRVRVEVTDDEYDRTETVEFSMKTDGVAFDVGDYIVASGGVGGRINDRGNCFTSLFARSVSAVEGVNSGASPQRQAARYGGGQQRRPQQQQRRQPQRGGRSSGSGDDIDY